MGSNLELPFLQAGNAKRSAKSLAALCLHRGCSTASEDPQSGLRKEQPAHCDKLPAEDDVFARVVVILRVLHHVLAQPLVLGALQCLLIAAWRVRVRVRVGLGVGLEVGKKP